MIVTIRPLEENDAKISYQWRNNPLIWKYTGSKPTKKITYEIELGWIREVLNRKNERRYAIMVSYEYVGNVQLTDISKDQAQFHIFIGNTFYWGKGVGTLATQLILEVAKNELYLKEIYLQVSNENNSAKKIYNKLGFIEIEKKDNQSVMIKKL